MTLKYAKSYYSVKKLISTSKRREEHPFAGQNTQQPWSISRSRKSHFELHLKQKTVLNTVKILLKMPKKPK